MYKDATETDIERIVSQYSPSLLRLAMTRLSSAADAQRAQELAGGFPAPLPSEAPDVDGDIVTFTAEDSAVLTTENEPN